MKTIRIPWQPTANSGARRRRCNPYVALAIFLLAALSGAAAQGEAASSSERAAQKPSSALKANKELAATLEKLNALKTWFSDAEKKRALWQQDIQSADREVAQLGRKVADLKDAEREIEKKQAQLAREAKALDDKRATERVRIAEHLNAAFRMSGQDFFKLLLNQENPEQFDRMIRYHQYFSTERGKTLQGYRDTLAAIETNRADAALASAKLKAQQAATAEEQKVFSNQLEERKKLVAGLDRSTRSKEAERKRLNRDSARLRDLLTELAKRSEKADGQEFAALKGSLPWPTKGTLRSRFGQPRADGRLRWQGSYMVTEAGEIIRSVHRGKVVFAEWLRGFGLLTIVDHGNGYMSLYGYADVLLKAPGDRVESGEQIANSGRSGGQDQDGLYFEIRKDGKPVDPAAWLGSQTATGTLANAD